jgi:hypothetical protein
MGDFLRGLVQGSQKNEQYCVVGNELLDFHHFFSFIIPNKDAFSSLGIQFSSFLHPAYEHNK